MSDTRKIVDPDELEKWFIETPDEVFQRSIDASKELMENPDKEQELFLEFEWGGKIYSQFYMNRKDIENALKKAINYYISTEKYEMAQIGKNLIDQYKNSL